MANVSPSAGRGGQRPAGTRFRTPNQPPAGSRAASSVSRPSPYGQASGARFRSAAPTPQQARPAYGAVQPVYQRGGARRHKASPVPVLAAILVAILAVAAIVVFVFPRVLGGFANQQPAVEAGQPVTLTVPDGASGDTIASLLSQNHVVEEPSAYYAAVKKLNAETSLKPGDYQFTTGQDPIEVVKQLVAGPNVEGTKLTIQEGLTVDQTAVRVEEAYGIPAADFKAQAKASTYAADYPFLEGAYNDSLEGFLYPKTYTFSGSPTADQVIRAMLDQFKKETDGIELAYSPLGLNAQQVVTVASLIERETAVEDERPTVASVIYNRLNADMLLQIDAAVVYARGGGSQAVTNDDLAIDSPYNLYKNKGLPAGPICSPSISSIKAAVQPKDTSYLYYVASAAGDGSHKFTDDYDEFLSFKQEYEASLS